MSELADYPYILHVPAMSRMLRDMLSEKRHDPQVFAKLPFVALRYDHPWIAKVPDGMGALHEITPTMLGLIIGIDRVLNYGSAIQRMRADNGNRWALGQSGEVPYPRVGRDGDEFRVEWLPLLVPCPLGFPAALNMSVALRPGRVLNGDEPIAVATRIASKQLPVVVAAGNWGQSDHLDTLSPIARLPWCISVGATSDPEGRSLWAKSSIGSPDVQPSASRATAPTVVAYGENAFVPGKLGTSFAVPRVTTAIVKLTAFLLQVQAAALQANGHLGSCPLLLRQSIDSGFKDFDPTPKLRLPMLPLLGVARTAARDVISALGDIGINDLSPTPAVVTRMLVACAGPMSGYSAHKVGAGFIAEDTVYKYLQEFTALDYAEAMCPNRVVSGASRTKLAALRLADDDELEVMLNLADQSTLRFASDFRSVRDYSSTPTIADMASHESVSIEPDPSFWPPRSD